MHCALPCPLAGPDKLSKRARILKRKSNPTKRVLAELAATGDGAAGDDSDERDDDGQLQLEHKPSVSSDEVLASASLNACIVALWFQT